MDKAQEDFLRENGNPAKPEGEAGAGMLEYMNEEHYEVTGWALSHFSFADGDRILDIGCGGGRTLARMARRCRTNSLTGVDYSPVSVAQTTKYNQELVNEGRLTVVEGSVSDLPFADASFDKIITVESFYFWPSPVNDLREVHRVLAESGIFLLVADIYERPDLPESAREHIRMYHMLNPTLEEFRAYFEKAGFSDIVVHTKEGTTWVCVEGHK